MDYGLLADNVLLKLLKISDELAYKEENPADLPLLIQELNAATDKAISQLPQKTQTILTTTEGGGDIQYGRYLDELA